jgi:uncharacterized protein YjbI with pentapeptide repeats
VANREHHLQLQKGTEAWNAWRRDKSNIRPDLGGADLGGADLGGANLDGANLDGANLDGANLIGARLGGADLIGATLRVADLSGANLHRATLHTADLSAARLVGALLDRADLSRALLFGAHLYKADLSGADLRGADLAEAQLVGANLVGANLVGANLAGAHWNKSTIWPDGYQPPDSSVPDGPPSVTRVERLTESGADVVRWSLEALLGQVSRLIDDPEGVAAELGLSDEDLERVVQYRSILLLALQGPDPDAVVIARYAARLLEFIQPRPDDTPALTEALEDADFADPAAAAADVLAIANAAGELGHEDAADDTEAVLVIIDRFGDLAEHAGEQAIKARPVRDAFKEGLVTYGRDEFAGVLVKWTTDPKIMAAVVAATSAAVAGVTGGASAALHWAWGAIQAIYQTAGQ